MIFRKEKKLTDQEIRTKYLNLVSVGCFLATLHQKSPYRKDQNHLLVNTIAEALQTERYTDLAYNLSDLLVEIADKNSYEIIVANFGASTALPESVKESVIYICMMFIFLSHTHLEDQTMGLIGDYCRALEFDLEKAKEMLASAESDASYYFVMGYAREFDDSHKILNDSICRAKSINIS